MAPKKPVSSISLIEEPGLSGTEFGSVSPELPASRPDEGECDAEGGSQLLVTFHKTLWALTPTEFKQHAFSTQDFIGILRQASRVLCKAKTELYLFNPATFSMPDGQVEGHRRQVNFVQSSALFLDFDNGQLSPEQFEQDQWG